jgi:hypothetical protein
LRGGVTCFSRHNARGAGGFQRPSRTPFRRAHHSNCQGSREAVAAARISARRIFPRPIFPTECACGAWRAGSGGFFLRTRGSIFAVSRFGTPQPECQRPPEPFAFAGRFLSPSE